MPNEYYDPERDRQEENATYFYQDMMMVVEDTDIKNDLIWLHRLIFNPFVCDPTKYGNNKHRETQDAIKKFREQHPNFEIDFSNYGIHEEPRFMPDLTDLKK